MFVSHLVVVGHLLLRASAFASICCALRVYQRGISSFLRKKTRGRKTLVKSTQRFPEQSPPKATLIEQNHDLEVIFRARDVPMHVSEARIKTCVLTFHGVCAAETKFWKKIEQGQREIRSDLCTGERVKETEKERRRKETSNNGRLRIQGEWHCVVIESGIFFLFVCGFDL